MDKAKAINISDLDVESRDWLKLEHNMKTFGFQEGATKGRELTLQEGFNEGFFSGFRMGIKVGVAKGSLSCAMNLGLSSNVKLNEKELNKFLNESCILCHVESNKETINKFQNKLFSAVVSEQEKHNELILKDFKITDCNLEVENK